MHNFNVIAKIDVFKLMKWKSKNNFRYLIIGFYLEK